MSIELELKTEYKALNAEMTKLRVVMQEKAKVIMNKAFTNFFEQYGEVVHSLYWSQYTPYFMDGDECVFSVNDVYILLEEDHEEENDDGEGSNLIGSQEKLDELLAEIGRYKEWKKDPMSVAKKYREDSMEKGYDPFKENSLYSRESSEDQMRKWKPFYVSLETLEARYERSVRLLQDFPNLVTDYEKIASFIYSIDGDIMKEAFGDHVKVIVTKYGIEVEEYEHD